MKKLLIDQGNTLVKCALINNDSIQKIWSFEQLSHQFLTSLLGEHAIEAVGLISVQKSTCISEFFADQKVLIFKHFDVFLPEESLFFSTYTTPKTLGLDRVAMILGACQLYPNQAVLIISLGTCMTVDFVDENAVHQGGSISLGLPMRLKALHHFTGKLPLLPLLPFEDELPAFSARDTSSCMYAGVYNGLQAEVAAMIAYYQQKKPNVSILFTGGDVCFLQKNIHQPVSVLPNLLFEGLNYLLNQHIVTL
ncbi:MAG: type III pantothenate kinase [Bacteroidota bacterium]